MAAKDPKAIAALIMGKMPPPGAAPGASPEASPEAPSDGLDAQGMDSDKAKEMAAEDVFNAVKSGDKGLFTSALKDYVTMCFQELEANPHNDAGEGY